MEAFALDGDYADDSTDISFDLSFTGAEPVTIQLQWLSSGVWVDVPGEPTENVGVYTWAFDAVDHGLSENDEVDFRVVLSNSAGTDTSATVVVTVVASGA